jgi:hypothetical protein
MSRRKKVQPATAEWSPRPGLYSRGPNPDANKTEYDLRSNLGQQFGSQGTLFQVSKRPRDIPGPKGFSPDRQDEVRSKTSVYADALAMNTGGWLKTEDDDRGRLTPESLGRRRHAQRQVQDIVSRSTAPIPSHVNVGVVQPDDRHLVTAGEHYGWNAAGGVYKTMANGPHAIASLATVGPPAHGHPNRLESKSLIHELGHHYSSEMNPGKDYSTPEGQGREEAFADDFSNLHTPRSFNNPNYEEPYTGAGRGEGFRTSYDAARTTPTTWHEAYHSELRNPNVPGSGHDALADPEDHPYWEPSKEEQANPTLPGMETAQDYTAKHYNVSRGFRRTKSNYEHEYQHTTRVLNRQTQSISDQLDEMRARAK